MAKRLAKTTFFRMMKLRLLLFGLFVIGLAKPLAQSLEGFVHLTFPLTKQKMLGIYLDARLYEYDPWLADVGATLMDQVEIEDLDLSTTADSLLDVHFSAQRKPRMEYYLSIGAYSGKGGTQYYFIDGFQKIFNGKDEDEIDLRLATRLDKKKPKGVPVHVGGGGGVGVAGGHKRGDGLAAGGGIGGADVSRFVHRQNAVGCGIQNGRRALLLFATAFQSVAHVVGHTAHGRGQRADFSHAVDVGQFSFQVASRHPIRSIGHRAEC